MPTIDNPGLLVALAALVLIVGGLVLWRRRLRTRDQQWRDVAPCYLSVQDRDLRIVEVNALFRRDFGDLVGEHCYRAYKDRKSPCPGCPVLKTFEDGQDHTGEELVVDKAGRRAQVLVTSTPFAVDRQGRPVTVLEMSTNITEVKQLQQELDNSRQHFQQLFDIVPCYISLQDRGLGILETNELFRRDFGQRVGERCYRAYKDRSSPCPDCPVLKTFEDGKIHSGEEEVITRNGSRANMIVHSMPVRDREGRIVSVMEVSTNITEVKRLQHQLAMMGLAVAGMAHRVKNILMGLEGGIFVVNTGMETDDRAQMDEGWEMVQRNVGKISRLVKDLLFCSKEREPDFQDDVAPDAVVREVCELYRKRIEREGIRLDVAGPSSVPPGRYDPEGIHNLVSNLLANAIDACRFDAQHDKQHVITVTCRADGGDVLVQVTDNGPGIPQEHLHRVFKGFFSTKGTEGTGLGLLVVQKVVEEHGGAVEVDSTPGHGATFTARLSPAGTHVAEPDPPTSAPEGS